MRAFTAPGRVALAVTRQGHPAEWHLDLKLPTAIVKMGYGYENMGEIPSGKASELGNAGDCLAYPS